MKKHPVTMFCGYQSLGHSPVQRFCNKKCSGYFVSRRLLAGQGKDPSARHGKVLKQKPFISSLDPLWREKGKRHQTRSGYIDLYFWSPELKMQFSRREHIIIWCMVHDRELPAGWSVHHRDEDRANNDPNNLLAMPAWMHMELHRELESLARECSGLEYLVQRHALTTEYVGRVAELCGWEALKYNDSEKENSHG